MAQAGDGEGERDALPRVVVMLVGNAIEDLEAEDQDAARQVLQMPLNHLGLRLERIGVDRDAPPPDVDARRVRAVGTWFADELQLPEWVWPWLERQQRAVRMLHFGSVRPLARADGRNSADTGAVALGQECFNLRGVESGWHCVW